MTRFGLVDPVIADRVRLSTLSPTDSEAIAAWLPDALAPEWGLADFRSALSEAGGVLISDAEGEPIGVAVVQADTPRPACAAVPLIAVAPARRFRGLGGEAGLALSRHLRASGFDKVYAAIPDGRGLAVYFWLRLGFRPLRSTEWPGPVTGLLGEERAGIWMLRDGD
jgi:GNAT superfamily N-acetyltransferase